MSNRFPTQGQPYVPAIEPIKKFGVIQEDIEKIMRVMTLLTEMLMFLDKNYENQYYTIGATEYKFITLKMDSEINRRLIEHSDKLKKYIKFAEQFQMTITFPNIKSRDISQRITEIYVLVCSYIYITGILDAILSQNKKFTKKDMKYINVTARELSVLIDMEG